jgi:hypothetical protein
MIVVFLISNAFDLHPNLLLVMYYATLAMAIFSGLHYILHVNRMINENQNGSQ